MERRSRPYTITPTDLESIINNDPRNKDVLEAYSLTIMGFDLFNTNGNTYPTVTIGDKRYDTIIVFI